MPRNGYGADYTRAPLPWQEEFVKKLPKLHFFRKCSFLFLPLLSFFSRYSSFPSRAAILASLPDQAKAAAAAA